jgi:hypothetical protein
MKIQLTKSGKKWSAYSALLSAMVYSALTLHSEPAFAQSCTLQNCASFREFATNVCESKGGLTQFLCPNTPADDTYSFKCANGFNGGGPC